MTSLIDVIFLLLLFFMLSSTFTRFAEVELTSGGSGGGMSDRQPVFLSLAEDTVRLNGTVRTLDDLPAALRQERPRQGAMPVIIAPDISVTAQRLTDLLVTLRDIPDLSVTVLDAR